MTNETDEPLLLSIPLSGGEPREGSPYQFTPTERAALRAILKLGDGNSVENIKFKEFCTAIGIAIGFYRAERDRPKRERAKDRKALRRFSTVAEKLRYLLEQLSPSAVRELDLALQAIEHFEKHSTNSDRFTSSQNPPTFSASMLHETSLGTGVDLGVLQLQLKKIHDAIEFAEANRRFDLGGRTANAAELILAHSVARAFGLLSAKPTTTIGGSYEVILRMALQAGGSKGADERDLRALVLESLKGMEPA